MARCSVDFFGFFLTQRMPRDRATFLVASSVGSVVNVSVKPPEKVGRAPAPASTFAFSFSSVPSLRKFCEEGIWLTRLHHDT
jgi:hypothetical protein